MKAYMRQLLSCWGDHALIAVVAAAAVAAMLTMANAMPVLLLFGTYSSSRGRGS
jgi:hypothetical protein